MSLFLHSLFAYSTIFLNFLAAILYALNYIILKDERVLKYAIVFHGVSVVTSVFAAINGLYVSNIPLVASKLPFIWGFPHKWNGLFFSLVNLVTFALVWLKREALGRKLLYISILLILLLFLQTLTGWMIKLVFFA